MSISLQGIEEKCAKLRLQLLETLVQTEVTHRLAQEEEKRSTAIKDCEQTIYRLKTDLVALQSKIKSAHDVLKSRSTINDLRPFLLKRFRGNDFGHSIFIMHHEFGMYKDDNYVSFNFQQYLRCKNSEKLAALLKNIPQNPARFKDNQALAEFVSSERSTEFLSIFHEEKFYSDGYDVGFYKFYSEHEHHVSCAFYLDTAFATTSTATTSTTVATATTKIESWINFVCDTTYKLFECSNLGDQIETRIISCDELFLFQKLGLPNDVIKIVNSF